MMSPIDRDIARTGALVAFMTSLVFLLPPLLFSILVYWRFDYFSLSAYIPHEAMGAALSSGDAEEIFRAPLLSANMTSGHLMSNMYTMTIGQTVLSVTLGVLIGLVLDAHLRLKRACAAGGMGRTGAGAGSGMLFTVTASSTGLVGCCGGSAASGGIIALAGLSTTTATQISYVSPGFQVLLIAGLAYAHWRLRARLVDPEPGLAVKAGRRTRPG